MQCQQYYRDTWGHDKTTAWCAHQQQHPGSRQNSAQPRTDSLLMPCTCLGCKQTPGIARHTTTGITYKSWHMQRKKGDMYYMLCTRAIWTCLTPNPQP
jgi:hypothetical protein